MQDPPMRLRAVVLTLLAATVSVSQSASTFEGSGGLFSSTTDFIVSDTDSFMSVEEVIRPIALDNPLLYTVL